MRNDLQHGFSRNLLTSKQKSYYENCFPEGLNKSADFIFHKFSFDFGIEIDDLQNHHEEASYISVN